MPAWIERLSPEERKAKRREWNARYAAKKRATAESAEQFRLHQNEVSNSYQKRLRAEDPEWRQRTNARSNRRYHEKIKLHRTEEQRAVLRETTRRYRARKRDEVKHHLQDLLGAKCAQCPVTDRRLLDFDHIDPLKKTMLISQELHRPLDVLLEEINNCQLLCPNCHRIKNIEQCELNSYVRKNREYRNKNRTGTFSLPN